MSYSSEVLADSPLAYWRLGDASGTTATDSSGNGRNATYTNTPTLAATGLLAGDADTAMTVASNTGQCASIASAAWMSVSTITVEAWVNFTSSFDSGNGDAIVSHYNSGGFQFLLWRDTSNHFAVQFVNSSVTAFNVTAATTPSLNTTYHVVATLDGSNAIKLYVNGSQVASGTLSGTLGATGTVPTEIGRYSASSTTTPGATIDEVAIYGSALSAARVAAHYAAGTGATSVAPPAATATASAPVPVVSASSSVSPPVAAATASAPVPAVGSANNTTVAPPAASATASAPVPVITQVIAAATDTSNFLNGRNRRARASVTVDRPAAVTPPRAAVKYDKAVPYPPPTLVDGRVT